MYKVTAFVHDEKLGPCLTAMRGHTIEHDVQYVTNAKVASNGHDTKKKVVPKTNGGTVYEQLAHYIQEHKVKELVHRDVGKLVQSFGFSKQSASYALKVLHDRGVLKKHGTGAITRYTVNGA